MMKVKTGEMVFGHSDIDADDYFTYSRTKRNYSVDGVSEGKKSFNNSRKIPSISLAEAEQKIEAMGITADKFTSSKPIEDTLNNLVNKDDQYKALGLNMAYERPNDGNQWYNTNPNDLTSRKDIDRYMKGYNDTLMLLDYLEGEAVLNKGSQALNNAWFKKVDKQYRGANTKNQFDKVRPLSDEEKAITLHTVDDLITNNFMTNRGPGNGVYNPSDFGSAYVTVPMMTGIYGGNTSEGAPGSMSFKHNTFRIWGYYGYEKGFLGYASNKYKQESKQAGLATLGDDFVIQKISEGRFNNLEEWKKDYFNEVVTSDKKGMQAIEVDGTTYSTYDDLKQAFATAVEKDQASLKNGSVKFDNTLALKERIFKKLLQQTDSFKTSIFK